MNWLTYLAGYRRKGGEQLMREAIVDDLVRTILIQLSAL